MNKGVGRIAFSDRACGPSDLSQSSLSQPEALVPCAWQPIETAPCDGPAIVGRIVGVRVDWWHEAEPPQRGRMWKMQGGFCDPTHWFSLPLRVEGRHG